MSDPGRVPLIYITLAWTYKKLLTGSCRELRKAGCKAARIYTTLPIHVTTSSLEKTGDEKLSPPRKVARPRRRRISRQMVALCFFPRGVSLPAQMIICPRETKRGSNQPQRARHIKDLQEVRGQPSSCRRLLKLSAMYPYLKNGSHLVPPGGYEAA
ncbi:hypothetical protein H112_04997 [Trichophyton rubrum D6]|uniref:Uncharacterized protein n=3 Tax=Trichophyton TaxID=5550 RepID=A0A080WFB0_TRIRC|nr:uncharacterized protein TERG_11893 [Trichophyton rubrum CBS 118892]EZF22079.1 hypothetical protein H100_05020 [Trichophyton rubrum MR850]EZF41121.1 hypothetical protein H102_05006 [Trichophyton rubrum CBS 100081]EZF51768.1 hypothetical protein H103_05008 [Trichophyton rubrum CBS 288.86]EZF62383.1 hypothetical protein H104_05001 [Trichophyton rubrum CBS 289.86]EZF72743.1 hypothetical protein H105_05026 [Trichophyton soudanense CBS 452.61]EZF83682.1 hypothetical protein H110_05006 [Trichophy